MPSWDVGKGTTKESYEAGRTGDHRTRGRQDQMGSGYWDQPANRKVLQDQQKRINRMQRRGEGIFSRPAKQGFFSGIGQKFKDWAGNMRGGINPLTNVYYTQDEYEQNVQNRRDQSSIDRIRKTKGLYDTGVIKRDWDQSPLKNRLARLEAGQWDRMNAMGVPTDTVYPGEGQGINKRVDLNDFEGVNFNEGITQAKPGLTMMEEFYNKPIQKRISDATGYNQGDIELTGLNQSQVDYLNRIKNEGVGSSGYSTYTKSERYPDQMAGAFFEYANPTDVWTDIENLNPKSTNLFSSAVNPEKIVEGDVTTFAQPDEVTNYIQSLSPRDTTYSHGLRKNVPGVDYTKKTWAQGGRVGYNTGGRVGILSVF